MMKLRDINRHSITRTKKKNKSQNIMTGVTGVTDIVEDHKEEEEIMIEIMNRTITIERIMAADVLSIMVEEGIEKIITEEMIIMVKMTNKDKVIITVETIIMVIEGGRH
jgi:hypothetical protein